MYLWLGIEDFSVFLIPALLAFGLCVSAGLGPVFGADGGGPAAAWSSSPSSPSCCCHTLVGVRAAYVEHDRSDDYGGRRRRSRGRQRETERQVLHHRSPLWYMVLVEERRRDLTLVDPFCTSWDRHTDLVWPDDISAAEAAERYGTGDTTGVEAARLAAENGPVYLLANARSSLRSFREAGFRVVPVGKGGELYRLVPGDR